MIRVILTWVSVVMLFFGIAVYFVASGAILPDMVALVTESEAVQELGWDVMAERLQLIVMLIVPTILVVGVLAWGIVTSARVERTGGRV